MPLFSKFSALSSATTARSHSISPSKARKRIGALGGFCYFHRHDPLIEADSVFLSGTAEEFKKKTTPTGVSGDPTLATREKGERYHRAVVENLVALIEEARATKASIKGTGVPV